MTNWIGVGIWIAMGVVAAFAVKLVVRRPAADSAGETLLLVVLSAIAATIGGMLGVGFFNLYRPEAIAPGPMISAGVMGLFMAWLYRWGTGTMV